MKQIKLRFNLRELPTGTILIEDSLGNYLTEDGAHSISSKFVEENPKHFYIPGGKVITLKENIAGLYVGCLLSLNSDGMYRDETGEFWFSERYVDENPNIFEVNS
jgi:hypothetical protein